MASTRAKERYQLVANVSLPIAAAVTPVVCRALGVLFVLLAVGYIALIGDLQSELYSSREHRRHAACRHPRKNHGFNLAPYSGPSGCRFDLNSIEGNASAKEA